MIDIANMTPEQTTFITRQNQMIEHESWCALSNLIPGQLFEMSYHVEQNGKLMRLRCAHCCSACAPFSTDEL